MTAGGGLSIRLKEMKKLIESRHLRSKIVTRFMVSYNYS